MSINQKDIKLLWGRSGNRCAICKAQLTQDQNAVTASFTLGEQAHIVGEKEEASRGKSVLPLDARNSYHNLILLCPNDHTIIDKSEEDWPVEKLHQIKSEHELWVSETLSESTDLFKLAQNIAVTNIIDTTVELCGLENWTAWTSWALSVDPQWQKDRINKINDYREKVIAAIWPEDFEDLKKSVITLSLLLAEASNTFLEHAKLVEKAFIPHKFYKEYGWNDNYHEDLEIYDKWVDRCHYLVIMSTKAANWFADIVRRDINPTFFADKGRFLVQEGPFEDLSFRTRLYQFTDEEKNNFPDSVNEI